MKDKIIKLLSEKSGEPIHDINHNTHLAHDLQFDSLDLIELVIEIEQMFKIENPPDCLPDNTNTVQDLINYVNKLTGESRRK